MIFQMYAYNAIFHRFEMFRVIQRDRTCISLHLGETKDKEIKRFDWQQKHILGLKTKTQI